MHRIGMIIVVVSALGPFGTVLRAEESGPPQQAAADAASRPAKDDAGPDRKPAGRERRDADKEKKEADKDSSVVEGLIEKPSVTKGEVALSGGPLKYTATAANMLMKDEEGKLKARVFFIAYEREHAEGADLSARPITFVFNGGPGAAAVWLHLGAAGPRRVDLAANGEPLAPPHKLVENASTWLDASDLVFIDPVGTGYSRPEKGEPGAQFYGVREDIAWMADFIRLYSTHYQRWSSPRFLAGESYGTTRAAGLSEHLLDRHGIALNGIVLISVVLHFQTLSPADANDLPYALFLPSYTAVAWYHRRLPPDLQADLERALEAVEAYSLNEYLPALSHGDALSPDNRRSHVERLARFTALPADFIDRANLRIDPSVFEKQLLAAEKKLLGRFDARILGDDPDPLSARPGFDPSFSGYLPVYSATFNDYVRRALKFESTLPYEVLSGRVRPWRMGEAGQGYLSVADALRSTMMKNPHLKVLFCSGYYDLATPYFATHYTINHLDLPRHLRANVRETRYQGGHMMYHHRPDLEKLHADVASFIDWAAPSGR